MKSRKLLMIVNPRAGKSKSRGPLFDAAAVLSQAGYLLSIHMTNAPGDAAETARREGGRYDLVVAVGGDGTLNEVSSGLVQLRKPPLLGYLPQGSTNDFAASLRISSDPAEAAAATARAVCSHTSKQWYTLCWSNPTQGRISGRNTPSTSG